MEVKAGYKRTDAGVIPEDWDVTIVREIASPIRNAIVGGPFGSDLVSNDYVDDGVPVIRGQNLGSKFISGDFVFVTEKKAKSLEANLAHPDDLVFTQRGTLGQVSIVPEKTYKQYLVSQSQMKLTVNRKLADPNFYYYLFTGSEQQKLIQENTIQTGVPHINLGILRLLPVQRPPLPEQKAIAEALSDVDAFIKALEQLLTKKRQVKQGTMQELLTGKKRLPGFSDEWEDKRLGDLLDFERPDKYIVSSTEYFENGSTPVLTANKSFVLGFTDEEFGIFDNLPVIVFDDFTTDKKYVDFPFKVKSSAIKILKPKNSKVNLWFVFGKMQLIFFPISDHKRYYISEYQHLRISMPTEKEQTAIAEILSDMDAEITALEAKLSKAQQVKQGMMQELLSGRVRLV